MKGDVLADAVHEFSHNGIFDELALSIDVGSELTAEANLFVKRVEIDLVGVDVALADHQGILVVGEFSLRSTHAALGGSLRGLLARGGLLIIGEQRSRRDNYRRKHQNRSSFE